ncbi:MAG: hypothetical protein BIP78_0582 [Candidatus Bipolaricaulis sibiricus]|uniref:Uncharacterized protein n=1 Tax=Bipolaricaulis sibiricus TaxID=2501609 RepID=A0A410FTS5_BIPS1|nr:MAG: hypothetical protein BIP78_0582 [Candidatus Bipolaricaulis sibiricus]
MATYLSASKGRDSQVARVALATIAALFLRSVLDFVYVNYVHRYFGGSLTAGAFPMDEINPWRVLESYVLVFLLAMWLSSSLYRRWRPSGIALVLYFAIVMLPLTSLYGLAGAPPAFIYAAAGSFAVLLIVTGLLPRVKVPRPDHNLLAMGTLLLVGMSVYVYGTLLLRGGLERLNFDLLAVYEVRAEFVQTRAPMMGYFVPWQAYVLNITLFCWGLAGRKWWLVAAAVAASLFLFGMVGVKAYLFAPALAGGVYFLWHRRQALFYVIGGMAVLVIASYVLFLVSGNDLALSLLVRRLFFVPAANHLIYYDFFSQPDHPFVMLSNSILEGFVRYPYDMPMVRMIAWEYWGRDFSPNVGYLGDAFAQFGFMGMFLFSMLFGLFLRIVDSVGARLPGNLVAAVVVMPAMALTNSALFTSLLTHGWIPAVVLLWLLRVVEEKRSIARKVKRVEVWPQQHTGAASSYPQRS